MRLLILRHAKAARPPDTDDFDRPLCDEGRAAALLIGGWMAARAVEPALVLCSSARRTRDTLALILPQFRGDPETVYEPGLYLAGAPSILQIVRSAPPKSPLMLVGHNPGLQEFGLAVLGKHQPGEAGKRTTEFAGEFPTAALAIVDVPLDTWQALKTGSGILAEFVRPKVLLRNQEKHDSRA